MGGGGKDGNKRFQEMCLIMSSESEIYSIIWNYLKNSTLLGIDKYPITTIATYEILFRYKKSTPQSQVQAPPETVKFFQCGDTEKIYIVPGNYGRVQKSHAISVRKNYIVR